MVKLTEKIYIYVTIPRTTTMKIVNIEGTKDNIGKIINVEITEVKTWSMNGKITC